MKRFDFHVHYNSDDPQAVANLADVCRKNNTIIAFSGGFNYGECYYPSTEAVLAAAKKYPDVFIPFASFKLWDTVNADDVYRYAELGCRGLKCIYPYYEYDHDIYMPVYEAAQKCGMPMLFHTGNIRPNQDDTIYRRPMLKNMHPLTLDRIARSFPDLKMVMAHLGTRIYQDEAAQYIKMHANLHADLGGCGQWKRIQPETLNELLLPETKYIDPTFANFRKIVLGSDAYVTYPHIITEAQKYYSALFDRIGVPQEIIDDIMGGTAAKWLGIDLED